MTGFEGRELAEAMSAKEFEKLVAGALDLLPGQFRDRLKNVAVVIEDAPTKHQIQLFSDRFREGEVESGEALLGLYEGIPQTVRGSDYTFVLPDKITIFRLPILAACRTEEEIQREIQTTVLHEIAHHFGVSDERLDDLEKY